MQTNCHPKNTSSVGLTLRKNLQRSAGDGIGFGAMVGLGETFLPAFALALGMGATNAGLVASLPVAIGGVMQLLSLRLMQFVGSEQRWVVLCAGIQALTFVPLAIAAALGELSFGVLLTIAAIYWTGGLASGPAWNTWMEHIVPRWIRPTYFAKRTMLQQGATLCGLLVGGSLLQFAAGEAWLMRGFLALFCVAGLARLASVLFLAFHQTPFDGTQKKNLLHVDTAAHQREPKDTGRSGMRLLVYLSIVQAFVQISGPFFAPYLLKELQVSYLMYVTLLASAFLSRILALRFWSTVAKDFGAGTLMWIGAVMLIPLSALWVVSTDWLWLVAIQILSGIAWGAYELAFFLLFFETLPHDRRTKMLTFYNLTNSLAMFLGASVGATIFNYLGCNQYAYYALFVLSSVGRLTAVFYLLRVKLSAVKIHYIAVRVLGIRTATATLDVPILPSLEENGSEQNHPEQNQSGQN